MKIQDLLSLALNKKKLISRYRSSLSLLNWDQEVNMPVDGAEARGDVFGDLVGIVSDLENDEEFKQAIKFLNENSGGLSDIDNRYVKKIFLDSDRSWKIPNNLSIEMARISIIAQTKWSEAKSIGDFSMFAPYLEEIISLKQKEIEALGYIDHPYDALLNQYEPNLNVRDMDAIFKKSIPKLKEIRDRYYEKSSNAQKFRSSIAKQRSLINKLSSYIGFDFNKGRIDIGKHPATEFIHNNDVRIIARFDEHSISTGIFLTLHELGHALYYQNINPDYVDTPFYEGASTAVHEAMARLLENNIAKSPYFLTGKFDEFKCHLDESDGIVISDLIKSINSISNSPLRFDADEITYVFHIFIRYEIEKKLIDGTLCVADVPKFWNKAFSDLLNVSISNDRDGCLQDVHWSCCLIGYFPTYYVGTIYAASIYAIMKNEVPNFKELLSSGDFHKITDWLSENIYTHGAKYSPEELMEMVTMKTSLEDMLPDFLSYIECKYNDIYKN